MKAVSWARSALRRRLPPNVRHAYYRHELRTTRRTGLPFSADPAVLETVAWQELGKGFDQAFHSEFGGYKHATAWLIWLCAGHRQATLVYKDVDLGRQAYPAIQGFPGAVGLPEAGIYGTPSQPLQRYLPHAYAVTEVVPGRRYQYYLADLGRRYRNLMVASDCLTAVEHLIRISQALRDWAAVTLEAPLLDYSATFPTKFLAYTLEAVSEYETRSGDRGALELLRDWDQVVELYLEATPPTPRDYVHGDYRTGNLFVQKANPTHLRAVDWEFAGRGWIHHDLASLFKESEESTVESGLRQLAEKQPDMSLGEHRRLLWRCRLERSLLDAALVARQRMAMGIEPLRVSRYHFVRARKAMEWLATNRTGGTSE